MGTLVYNERAWAADVISQANAILAQRKGKLRRAGGEAGIRRAGATTRFPDVLLFTGAAGTTAVQGWELKFPDTPIWDPALRDDATEKAARLKTDSFVLWNVTAAELWIKDATGVFACAKSWTDLSRVTKRTAVLSDPTQWGTVLEEILTEVEALLRQGALAPPTLTEVLGPGKDSLVTSIVSGHLAGVGAAMKLASGASAPFRDSVTAWWQLSSFEYADNTEKEKWKALAGLVVSGWLNRFTLAHLLRPTNSAMDDAIDLPDDASAVDAMKVMHGLPAGSDFARVFGPSLGEDQLTPEAWLDIRAYNDFLKQTTLASGHAAVSTGWFHQATATARAGALGQYATPRCVATLLCALAVDNFVSSDVIDPCCGTGTIARAVYDFKRRYVGAAEAYAHTWLSDKFAYPLQSAHLALVDPATPDSLIRVFQDDVFRLEPGATIDVADPTDGTMAQFELPVFDVVLTNAPFVRFEDYASANPDAAAVADWLAQFDLKISGRADLYAFVLAQIWRLLRVGGRAGVVTSNSWLGTDAGASFRDVLRRLFDLEMVVISGSGRWFAQADVVTTLLVLRKRSDAQVRAGMSSEATRFATTMIPVASLDGLEEADALAAELRASVAPASSQRVRIRVQRPADIARLDALGLAWTAAFTDTSWLVRVEPALLPASDLLEGGRGERGGANDFFYPKGNHGIEEEYLTQILRRPSRVAGLTAEPEDVLFRCGVSRDQLKVLGHRGALAWIDRHASVTNDLGRTRAERLGEGRASGRPWYEHPAPKAIDFVTFTNPDQRFFFARRKPAGYVDQRFICFTAREGIDAALCHALLNCTLSTYFLEGMGFGRGLGVLDLNATKVVNGLRIFDPSKIDDAARTRILDSFAPLLERDIEGELAAELAMGDRREFDLAVMGVFGVADALDAIHLAILEMHEVRKAARG